MQHVVWAYGCPSASFTWRQEVNSLDVLWEVVTPPPNRSDQCRICVYPVGLKVQSLQGARSTSQVSSPVSTPREAGKRLGNSWLRTQHMSKPCDVCPTRGPVNRRTGTSRKQMLTQWWEVSWGIINIGVGCCWSANKGGAGCTAGLRWRWRKLELDKIEKKGGEEDRCEMTDGAWTGKISVSLFSVSPFWAPGCGFKGEDGLRKNNRAPEELCYCGQEVRLLFAPRGYWSLRDVELRLTYSSCH